MQRFNIIFSVFAFILSAASMNSAFSDEHEHKGHGHETKSGKVTLKGEVLDLHCYLLHPDTGKGSKHAKCATACIKKGLPSGFISEGQVYLLLGLGHGSAKDLVAQHTGHEVSLTGKLIDLNGIKSIQVESIGGAEGHGQHDGHGEHGHDD